MVKCGGDRWKELDSQVIMSPNRFQWQQKIPVWVTSGEESGLIQLLTHTSPGVNLYGKSVKICRLKKTQFNRERKLCAQTK